MGDLPYVPGVTAVRIPAICVGKLHTIGVHPTLLGWGEDVLCMCGH